MRTMITILLVGLCGCMSAAADAKADVKVRILAALQSTDIYSEDSKPFRLEARVRLTFDKPVEGTYSLLWVSSHLWRQEVQLADYREVWVRNGDKQWISRSLAYPPLRVLELVGFFGAKIPMSGETEIKPSGRREVQSLVLDCAKVTTKNLDTGRSSKEEFCVNGSTGVPVSRKSDLGDKVVEVFEDYSSFGDKQFPRTLRRLQDDKPLVEAQIDRLKFVPSDASEFLPLPGVDAWPTCDHVKHPEPKHSPDPSYSPEARERHVEGVDIVYALVGIDGTVTKADVVQLLEQSLDSRALSAVKSWRFQPAMCGNSPVPSEITVQVTFRMH